MLEAINPIKNVEKNKLITAKKQFYLQLNPTYDSKKYYIKIGLQKITKKHFSLSLLSSRNQGSKLINFKLFFLFSLFILI